jgi:hypothetical protein
MGKLKDKKEKIILDIGEQTHYIFYYDDVKEHLNDYRIFCYECYDEDYYIEKYGINFDEDNEQEIFIKIFGDFEK